jgi:hypothetical protein
LIGAEGLASAAGLVEYVVDNPSLIFQLDEIGRMLKTLGDARNPHLYAIPSVLLKMFSSSRSVYIGDAYADSKRNKKIHNPNVCIYGTTVPKSLYEGLTADSITDGFLSRLLVFESKTNPRERDVQHLPAPPHIKSVAEYWGSLDTGGNLSSVNATPFTVGYTNDAIAAMGDLRDFAHNERIMTPEPYGTLWTRCVEKARKLCLLYACSEKHQGPVVELPAVQWAAELSVYLTRSIIHLADTWIAENRQESTSKRVERLIPVDPGIGLAQLTRRTRWLTARERNEIIEGLKAAGIVRVDVAFEGTGRPVTKIMRV